MGKLKGALAAHQAQAAWYAQQQKAQERQTALAKGKGKGQGEGKSKSGKAVSGPSAGSSNTNKKRKVHLSTEEGSSSILPSASGTGEDSAAALGAGPSTSTSSSKPKPSMPSRKPTIPFDSLDTILLLGEANFSFARALLLPPHSFHGHMICATSYDTEKVCYEKYPDARAIVEELKKGGVDVKFGVDAGDLPRDVVGNKRAKRKVGGDEEYGYKHQEAGSVGRWSRVVFNFPHAGEFSARRSSISSRLQEIWTWTCGRADVQVPE